MLNSIKSFILDESGLETVEWAIVGGVIVAVGAALFITIGAVPHPPTSSNRPRPPCHRRR